MKKTLLAGALLFLVHLCAYADETVNLDNTSLQEFKGKPGQWVMVESDAALQYYLGKFQASYEEVRKINGVNFSFRQYIFVPYSENYLKELESKKITREKITISGVEAE